MRVCVVVAMGRNGKGCLGLASLGALDIGAVSICLDLGSGVICARDRGPV